VVAVGATVGGGAAVGAATVGLGASVGLVAGADVGAGAAVGGAAVGTGVGAVHAMANTASATSASTINNLERIFSSCGNSSLNFYSRDSIYR
jgi:hypothetical protein